VPVALLPVHEAAGLLRAVLPRKPVVAAAGSVRPAGAVVRAVVGAEFPVAEFAEVPPVALALPVLADPVIVAVEGTAFARTVPPREPLVAPAGALVAHALTRTVVQARLRRAVRLVGPKFFAQAASRGDVAIAVAAAVVRAFSLGTVVAVEFFNALAGSFKGLALPPVQARRTLLHRAVFLVKPLVAPAFLAHALAVSRAVVEAALPLALVSVEPGRALAPPQLFVAEAPVQTALGTLLVGAVDSVKGLIAHTLKVSARAVTRAMVGTHRQLAAQPKVPRFAVTDSVRTQALLAAFERARPLRAIGAFETLKALATIVGALPVSETSSRTDVVITRLSGPAYFAFAFPGAGVTNSVEIAKIFAASIGAIYSHPALIAFAGALSALAIFIAIIQTHPLRTVNESVTGVALTFFVNAPSVTTAIVELSTLVVLGS